MTPRMMETTVTVVVSLVRVSLSGQVILLNSARSPRNHSLIPVFFVLSLIYVTPYPVRLLGFFVIRVLLTESTILLGLKSFRMILLFLCRIVVTLFALCACQGNSNAQNFHLQLIISSGLLLSPVFGHKKKTYSIATLL